MFATSTDIILPAFLDPLLEYLASVLPSPIFSVLISLLAHCLALITALFSVISTLLTSNPLTWDTQKVLPPVISLFAAYLAFISIYRTTSWFVRTSFWLIKWAIIIAMLSTLAGWYGWYASSNGGTTGDRSMVSVLVRTFLDMINGQGQNAAGNPQHQQPLYQEHTRRSSAPRPKPWEKFERHHEWQYGEREEEGNRDAQNVIGGIVDAASRVLRENGWWDAAKGVVDDVVNGVSGSTVYANTQSTKRSEARTGRNSRSR